MNEQPVSDSQWCENIIIANADFIDRVAFDLTVNFERIIGRRIPRADMAQWVECVAMDAGTGRWRISPLLNTTVSLAKPSADHLENLSSPPYAASHRQEATMCSPTAWLCCAASHRCAG